MIITKHTWGKLEYSEKIHDKNMQSVQFTATEIILIWSIYTLLNLECNINQDAVSPCTSKITSQKPTILQQQWEKQQKTTTTIATTEINEGKKTTLWLNTEGNLYKERQ
jgi:hypothetical protein